jgi:hypothetical protein
VGPASRRTGRLTVGRNITWTWTCVLRSEKRCAGDARQKLKITKPTSCQRGRPTSTNPQLSKNNQRESGKNWSQVPDGCLTQGRTGRLTVGRNITLTLTLINLIVGKRHWDSLGTQRKGSVRRWKPITEDWWRNRRPRRLSVHCNELENMWIDDSVIVNCKYELCQINQAINLKLHVSSHAAAYTRDNIRTEYRNIVHISWYSCQLSINCNFIINLLGGTDTRAWYHTKRLASLKTKGDLSKIPQYMTTLQLTGSKFDSWFRSACLNFISEWYGRHRGNP